MLAAGAVERCACSAVVWGSGCRHGDQVIDTLLLLLLLLSLAVVLLVVAIVLLLLLLLLTMKVMPLLLLLPGVGHEYLFHQHTGLPPQELLLFTLYVRASTSIIGCCLFSCIDLPRAPQT